MRKKTISMSPGKKRRGKICVREPQRRGEIKEEKWNVQYRSSPKAKEKQSETRKDSDENCLIFKGAEDEKGTRTGDCGEEKMVNKKMIRGTLKYSGSVGRGDKEKYVCALKYKSENHLRREINKKEDTLFV